MAKPTTAELITAATVVAEIFGSDSIYYERIVDQIPAEKRPPRSVKWSVEIRITGADPDNLPRATDTAILGGMVKNWAPFTVGTGKNAYTVAPEGTWG